MTPYTEAVINLGHLQHNAKHLQEAAGTARLLPVLKCQAYGHGAVPVAHALANHPAFAVARVEEALQLREAGIKQNLVILSGMRNEEECLALKKHTLQPVIHHSYQLDVLQRLPHCCPDTVWLKYDSGMHRLGFDEDGIEHAIQTLKSLKVSKIVLISHLAQSEHPRAEQTQQQYTRYHRLIKKHGLQGSLANSGALLQKEPIQQQWARPGIALYGATSDNQTLTPALKEVMTLRARIISLKKLRAGDHVGYGATFTARHNMRMAVVAIGYGDGYPRHCPSGTPTRCQNSICPLVGRVSMDMISIDVTHLQNPAIGDWVTLWGEGLPIERIAHCAGTLPYELLCHVNPRVVRRYTAGQ